MWYIAWTFVGFVLLLAGLGMYALLVALARAEALAAALADDLAARDGVIGVLANQLAAAQARQATAAAIDAAIDEVTR